MLSTMSNENTELEAKKARLQTLLESRSKANCDTRNMTSADVRREEEIEELEDEIKALEA